MVPQSVKPLYPNRGISMNHIETIGLIGSFLTSLSYLPQVIKSWQSKNLSGVSIWNPVVALISGAFWLYYAVALSITPVLVSTAVIGACNVTLVIMKLIYVRDIIQTRPATDLIDIPQITAQAPEGSI
jgi:MtN3 and saliva related transmembrane protein